MPSRPEASHSLLEPAGSLVEYIIQGVTFAGLAEKGIYTLMFVPPLVDFAELYTRSLPSPPALPFEKLRTYLAESRGLAEEEQKSDFSTLRAHSIVAMWSAVETTVDQILLNMSLLYPDKLSSAAGDATLPATPSEDEVKRLYRKWKASVHGSKNNVIERHLYMLSALGLPCSLDDSQIAAATEINEVRNIIVHNKAVVDDRFLSRCPHLTVAIGQKYLLSMEKFVAFHDTLSAYSISILKACTDFLLTKTFDDP